MPRNLPLLIQVAVSYKQEIIETRKAVELLKQRIREENEKPVKISIMGQTGVGKSSLINALFNTKMKTDPAKPCTKEVESYEAIGIRGHKMIFYDLPGIVESEEADEKYFTAYIEKMKESDIVLWALHSDNRSITFDKLSLERLMKQLDANEKISIFSKITFVLTKADILSPPAWVCGKVGNEGIFSPLADTKKIIEEKKQYYQENFILPYAEKLISFTYNDCDFKLDEKGFDFDEYSIIYNGVFDKETFENFSKKYPKYKKAFIRLYNNYEVIPCSSLLKYNLTKLMVVIVNKIGGNAIGRFKNFIQTDRLSRVCFDKVKNMGNIILVDKKENEVIFDFSLLNIFKVNKNDK